MVYGDIIVATEYNHQSVYLVSQIGADRFNLILLEDDIGFNDSGNRYVDNVFLNCSELSMFCDNQFQKWDNIGNFKNNYSKVMK